MKYFFAWFMVVWIFSGVVFWLVNPTIQQARDLKFKCESSLPRNQKCVMEFREMTNPPKPDRIER